MNLQFSGPRACALFLSVTLIGPLGGCSDESPTSSGAPPTILVQAIDVGASVLDLSFDREGRTFDLLAQRPLITGRSPDGDELDVGPWRWRLRFDPIRNRAYYADGDYRGIDLTTGEVSDPFPFHGGAIAFDHDGRIIHYDPSTDATTRRTCDPVTTEVIEVVELEPGFFPHALSLDGSAAVGSRPGSETLVVARGDEVHVIETGAFIDVLGSRLRALDPTGRRLVYFTASGWTELDLDTGESTALPWTIEEALRPGAIQWTETGIHLAGEDALLRIDEDGTVTRRPIPLSYRQRIDDLVPVRGSDPWAAIQTTETVTATGTIGVPGLVSQIGEVAPIGPVASPYIATSPDGSRFAFCRSTDIDELVVRDRTGDETAYELPDGVRGLTWTDHGITLLDSHRTLLHLDPEAPDASLAEIGFVPEAHQLLPGATDGRVAVQGRGVGAGRYEVLELDERDGKKLLRRSVDGRPVAAAPRSRYASRYLCWSPSGLIIDGLPRVEVVDVEGLRTGSGRFRPGTDTILAWSGTDLLLLLRR